MAGTGRKGEGMIYKRGNIYWLKYYDHGKPIFESTRTTKITEAQKLLKRRLGDIANGKPAGVTFDRVRFDDLANDFITYRRTQKGEKSGRDAEVRAKPLKAFFGGLKVPKVTTSKVRKYVEKRQAEGFANATINRELAALKCMLRLGAKETPPRVDRVAYIEMLPENNARKGFFQHEDFLRLRDALPSYMQPFVTFAYKSGWRWREMAGLTWNDIDLERGTAWLDPERSKTKDGRTFFFDSELAEIFEALATKKQGPYVFQNNGEPILNFRRAWNRACRGAGLGYGYKVSKKEVRKWEEKGNTEGPILHDFRRTAVRNLVRSGVPEKVAMRISGHKTRSVFDRYNICNDDDIKEAMQRLELYLKSKAKPDPDGKPELKLVVSQ